MIRDAYLEAPAAGLDLLRDPAVRQAWSRPSALAEFSVGGLAAHLSNQVIRAVGVVESDPATETPLDVLEHYRRAAWADGDLDSEANTAIRHDGELVARQGPEQIAGDVEAALARLTKLLPEMPADRVVHLPWTGWSLTLDDFLLTRVMEIVVHGDDLEVSVGVDPPELPPAATEATVRLLAAVAVDRHGPYPVIRALSRAERAPATVTAF